MTKAEGFKDQGEYTPDNLLAGEYPRVERVVTIADRDRLQRLCTESDGATGSAANGNGHLEALKKYITPRGAKGARRGKRV